MIQLCCRHFNGDIVNKVCLAGVRYDDVTQHPERTGKSLRRPCRVVEGTHSAGEKGECALYDPFSVAEIREQNDELERSVKQMESIEPALQRFREKYEGTSTIGRLTCPRCNVKGHLRISLVGSSLRGRCKTDGCIIFME